MGYTFLLGNISVMRYIAQYARSRRIRTSRSRMWIAVEDKSIFIHDALIRRRMWTPEGKRPIVTVAG